MKFVILLATLLAGSLASATDYEFHALYEKDGFVTERMLPFKVIPTQAGSFTVDSVRIEPPCFGMVDLYRSDLVLIYCTQETETAFSILTRRDGVLYEVKAPAFEVKKVALISSTPDGPGVSFDSPGKKLFKNNECTKCHPSPNLITKPAAKTHLTNAFAGKAMRNGKTTKAMKQFDKFFTSKELDSLVKFINEEL